MKQIIKKRFDIIVSEAKQTVKEQFELDKNVTRITGLMLTSDREDLLYHRGSQKIEINNEEIVPEKYESKLLLSGMNVSPNERFYKINNTATGNRLLKMEYTDTDDGRSYFSIYRVSIYVECEIETI
ncbi:MAG: hypothetical protein IPI46_09905 [Bacteroidetes bacterium]|nr:hypothetical protein [Bacteroidota bacterium]